jgi:hypothetical protein
VQLQSNAAAFADIRSATKVTPNDATSSGSYQVLSNQFASLCMCVSSCLLTNSKCFGSSITSAQHLNGQMHNQLQTLSGAADVVHFRSSSSQLLTASWLSAYTQSLRTTQAAEAAQALCSS